MSVLKDIKNKRLYFDGGFGSLCIDRGLKFDSSVELSLTNPNEVVKIHKEYIDAGANIITANTFSANCLKYPKNYKKIITTSIELAKKARGSRKDVYVFFDIGSLGKMLKPFGDLDFERAVEIFKNSVKVANDCGVDGIIIETMNDSYETKACVVACKESCSLPIFVTNVYDKSGKLLTGGDILSTIAMLEGLGVDAIGMNCSFGPDAMLKLVDKFIKYSSLPIIVNPNAGLPSFENGKTVYKISSEKYADYMYKLAKKGVQILGGCCGTTPDFIKKTVEKTKDIPYNNSTKKDYTVISSGVKSLVIGEKPLLIGERINPTGKPLLKEALKKEDYNYLVLEGVKQEEKGVHILDVNVGLAGILEEEVLKKAVFNIQSSIDLPLQIDTSNFTALENACRIYNGKPLINSVNGKEESMQKVFSIVKKYGGTIIALTLDENGIPNTASGRVKIANKIINTAKKYGISKKDIIIDPLCLTITSNKNSAKITLETIKKLNKLGLKTSLGVSNISFGLPSRNKINATFYAQALNNGLNLAIINPFSTEILDVYHAYNCLGGFDELCKDFIDYANCVQVDTKSSQLDGEITLEKAIIKGLKSQALNLVKDLLKDNEPLDILNQTVIPALTSVGVLFEEKKVFLPQLLQSAETTTAVFELLKTKIKQTESKSQNKVIIATVKGDIHDIGKNIAKVLLESHGFIVYDLGKDVSKEEVLSCVIKNDCKLVGLSALMTTTVSSMEEIIKHLKANVKDIVIMVGGAVLTQEYSDSIGADYYCKDALQGVKCAKKYYEN